MIPPLRKNMGTMKPVAEGNKRLLKFLKGRARDDQPDGEEGRGRASAPRTAVVHPISIGDDRGLMTRGKNAGIGKRMGERER